MSSMFFIDEKQFVYDPFFQINHVPILSNAVLGSIVKFTSSCDCCCWCTHTILRRLSLEMTRYICLAFHKMCIAAMMNHNASSWVGPNEAEDSCRASGNSPRKGPEKILRVRSRSRHILQDNDLKLNHVFFTRRKCLNGS